MKPQKTVLMSLGILLTLPGCGSLIDWADETFYQGKMHEDHQEMIKPFLKGMRLYDQFDTVAVFDALWLSDTVRTAYAQAYSRMTGSDEEGYIDFLRRELSSTTYFVSFYVLSLNTISLTATPPEWAVHLEIDGKKYLPAEIKVVELSPEYIGFFGKRINNHKQPYEIRFNRKDPEDKDVLAGKSEMKLVFSCPRYFGSISWKVDEDAKAVIPAFVVTSELEREKKEKEEERQAKKEAQKKKRPPRKGRLLDTPEVSNEKNETVVTIEENRFHCDPGFVPEEGSYQAAIEAASTEQPFTATAEQRASLPQEPAESTLSPQEQDEIEGSVPLAELVGSAEGGAQSLEQIASAGTQVENLQAEGIEGFEGSLLESGAQE